MTPNNCRPCPGPRVSRGAETRSLASILECLLSTLYPPACALCGREPGRPKPDRLCRRCRASLERISLSCPRCGLPGAPAVCGRCVLEPPPFRSARAALIYREGNAVARAIQRWKYGRDEAVGAALAALLRAAVRPIPLANRRIVPVPADPRRLRERGFNPALVLARAVATTAREVAPRWLRRRVGPPQVGAGRGARAANTASVFLVAPGARVRGVAVLLIDDVFTTGATVRSCALALRDAGASVVDVVTLAHTALPESQSTRSCRVPSL